MDYYTQVLAALSVRGPMDPSLAEGATDVHEWTTTFDPRFNDARAAQSLAAYLARDLRACGATAAALTLRGANMLVLTYRAPRAMGVCVWRAMI